MASMTPQPAKAAVAPPDQRLSPWKWVKTNLLNNWYNAIISLALVAVAILVAIPAYRFVFISGRWEPVETNLTLLMIGKFPRGEEWRIILQTYFIATAIGLFWGIATIRGEDRAAAMDTPFTRPNPFDLLKRYWPILLLLIALVTIAETIYPTIFTASAVIVGMTIRSVTMRLPRNTLTICGYAATFLAILSFQILSGTGGIAWWWMSGLVAFIVLQQTSRIEFDTQVRRTVIRIGSVILAVVVVYLIYNYGIGDTSSVSWDNWGGLYLTLIFSTTGILLAFPLSLLLALGRRSTLPVVRGLCVGYIELFRGVPLITLLFIASDVIGFFLDTETRISVITRVIAAFTIFSSAYLAEVVRGGLQAVPKGQIEAGQSVGLPQLTIMRLIVIPQALRAVIPAMVGQFISLFKDSSLLAFVSIVEFLRVRQIIHQQEGFQLLGIAETLVFIAFGYWTISYTMSKESQRFERRIGVGKR